jgi:hypothetical protein
MVTTCEVFLGGAETEYDFIPEDKSKAQMMMGNAFTLILQVNKMTKVLFLSALLLRLKNILYG